MSNLLYIQTVAEDVLMAAMKMTTLRLSSVQIAQLAKLALKLQIDRANVIRLAISRLAEQEGITRAGGR